MRALTWASAERELRLSLALQPGVQTRLSVAIGSSLVVYPAAALPGVAKTHGAQLAILNREPTGFDRMADLVINAEIGDTLSASFPGLA